MTPFVLAFDALRRRCGATSATLPLAFLYVCENEGLSVHELALVARLTESTASRAARALAEPDCGLAETRQNPENGAMLSLGLTSAGAALRDELDEGLAPYARKVSAESGKTGGRRRSHVLSALEALRGVDPAINLTKALALLIVLERPGVDLAALAVALEASEVTASRSVRVWLADDRDGALPPAVGFLEMRLDPRNNRRRLFRSSQKGIEFEGRLGQILEAGVPLRR